MRPTDTDRLLVIGIGNRYRRDDGVGPAVIDELRTLNSTTTLLDLLESDGEPTRILDLWEGADRVVVIDAMRSGAPPGTIRHIDAWTDRLPDTATASTHAAGVGHAVELGRVLDRLPRKLSVICVEGSDFSEGPGLSTAVAASVIGTAEAVLGIGQRPQHTQESPTADPRS